MIAPLPGGPTFSATTGLSRVSSRESPPQPNPHPLTLSLPQDRDVRRVRTTASDVGRVTQSSANHVPHQQRPGGGGGGGGGRGGVGHLGLMHTGTRRSRLWTAGGRRRCVGSKNRQTTPAATHTPAVRQLLGPANAQTAHPAATTTAPTHHPLGSANAATTPAGAPAAAADRKQRPNATCGGQNG